MKQSRKTISLIVTAVMILFGSGSDIMSVYASAGSFAQTTVGKSVEDHDVDKKGADTNDPDDEAIDDEAADNQTTDNQEPETPPEDQPTDPKADDSQDSGDQEAAPPTDDQPQETAPQDGPAIEDETQATSEEDGQLLRDQKIEAELVKEPLYKDNKQKRRTAPYRELTSLWENLMGRDAAASGDDADLKVILRGELPEGARAEARYISLEEGSVYTEKGLFAIDVTIYDAEGHVYVPLTPVTITVKSSDIKQEIKDGNAPILYSYLGNPKRADKYSKKYNKSMYAADAAVFESEEINTDLLKFEPYDETKKYKKGADAVRYAPDAGYLELKKNSVSFDCDFAAAATGNLLDAAAGLDAAADLDAEEETGVPKNAWTDGFAGTAHLVLTSQMAKRTVRAKAGASSVKVTGHLAGDVPLKASEIRKKADRNSYVQEAEAQLEKDPSATLSFAQAIDISLTDPASGAEFEPDSEIKVSIDLNDEKLSDADKVSVVHFKEAADGKTVEPEVVDSSVKGDTVKFTTDGCSVYVVLGYTVETWYRDSEGKDWKITAKYGPETGLPMGAELKVRELAAKESKEYLSDTAKALGKAKRAVRIAKAFDISFEKDGKTYHKLDGDVDITIELIGKDLDETAEVVHFTQDDGKEKTAEKMKSETEGNAVSFRSDEFSVYIVSQTELMKSYVFYNGDNVFSEQVLISGESVVMPPIPSKGGAVFDHWKDENDAAAEFPQLVSIDKNALKTTVAATLGKDADDVTLDEIQTYLNANPVEFHAVYKAAKTTITYYNQAGLVVEKTDVTRPNEGDPAVSVDTNEVTYIPTQEKESVTTFFEYWTDDPLGTSEKCGTGGVLEIKSNSPDKIDLYPVLKEGHYIYFDGNKSQYSLSSVDYTAAQKVLDTEGSSDAQKRAKAQAVVRELNERTNKAIPTTTGYTFKGWYLRSSGAGDTSVSPSGNLTEPIFYPNDAGTALEVNEAAYIKLLNVAGNLPNNPTLYAHWTKASTADYTVVIWREKLPAPYTASTAYNPNAEKEYVFAESIPVKNASTSGSVTLADYSTKATNATESSEYYGFHYNATASDTTVTVNPDGSTIANVYYDRDLLTLTFRDHTYTRTTSNTGTQYGLVNGQYVELLQSGSYWYYVSGSNYVRYTGSRYTRSSYPVFSITEPYGRNISGIFPINGTNGTVYDNGERWKPVIPQTTASGQNKTVFNEVLVYLDIMPIVNVTFDLNTSTNTQKTIYYYVQTLPGETVNKTYNGIAYKLYHETKARYGYFTEAEDFLELTGFDKNGSEPPFVNGRVDDSTLNLYYLRKSFDLNYYVNYPAVSDSSFQNGKSEDKTEKVNYEANLASYESSFIPKEPSGYMFGGWYADEEGTIKVFLTEPTQAQIDATKDSNGDAHYVVYKQMPANAIQLYAKWTPVKNRVTLIPDGGEMNGVGITQFHLDAGEKISLSAEPTRDFVKVNDSTGSHTYDPVEGHYELTGENNGNYNESPGAYRFQGWYQAKLPNSLEKELIEYAPGKFTYAYGKYQQDADNNGAYAYNESTNTHTYVGTGGDYNFVNAQPEKSHGDYKVKPDKFDLSVAPTTPVTLVAMWQRTGEFRVVYDTVDPAVNNQPVEAPEDQEEYIDGAHARVLPALTAPKGYALDYWQGPETDDHPDGHYLPNELVHVTDSHAELDENGKDMVVKLTAHYREFKPSERFMADYKFLVDKNNDGTYNGDANDANNEIYEVQRIAVNEELKAPITPGAPDGYTFKGWYYDSEGTRKFDGFGVITNPTYTTLYAVFEKVYTVTYYLTKPSTGEATTGEATQTVIATQTYTRGQKLDTRKVIHPVDTDHFVHFWVSGGLNNFNNPDNQYPYRSISNKIVTANLNLFAYLGERKYVRFDSQGGSYVETQEIPDNGWPVRPNEPTRKGYTFKGWFTDPTDPDSAYEFDRLLSGSQTVLYAHWQPNETEKGKITVVWWAQTADRPEDQQQADADTDHYQMIASSVIEAPIGEYDLTDSADLAKINLPEGWNNIESVIGSAQNAGQNSATSFLNENGGVLNDLSKYYAYSSVASKQIDNMAVVTDKGNTTLNIRFDLQTYRIIFDLKLKGFAETAPHSVDFGRIHLDSDNYKTGTQYQLNVWLNKNIGLQWPVASTAREAANGAKGPWFIKTEDTSQKFNGWCWQNNEHAKSTQTETYPTGIAFVGKDLLKHANASRELILHPLDSGDGTYGYTHFMKRVGEPGNYQWVEIDDSLCETIIMWDYSRNTNFEHYHDNRTDSLYYYSGPFTAKTITGYDFIVGSNRLDDEHYARATDPNTGLPYPQWTQREGGGDYDLYIYYRPAEYSLSLYDNSTSAGQPFASGTVEYMEQLTGQNGVLNDPQRLGAIPTAPDGFEFGGWSLAPGQSDPSKAYAENGGKMPARNLVLYAIWKPIRYTVTTVDIDSDNDGSSDVYRADYGQKLKELHIPNPKADGKLFMGWMIESTSTQITGNYEIKCDLRIKPIWNTVDDYSVVYDANGGSGTLPMDTNRYMHGAKVIIKDGKDLGKSLTNVDGGSYTATFAYWNTKSDGSGDTYYPNSTYTFKEGAKDEEGRPLKKLTLYAIYSELRETVLTYDKNADDAAFYYADNNWNAIPNSTYMTQNPDTIQVFFRDMLNEVWQQKQWIPNQVFPVGKDESGEKFTVKRTDGFGNEYLLAGWATESDASLAIAQNGDKAYVNTIRDNEGNLKNTLYAVWGICKVVDKKGKEHVFDTIQKAVNFINTTDLLEKEKTGTIEMLIDYKIGEDFAVTIPEGCDVTLTTAAKSSNPKFTGEKHFYQGSGTIATITQEMTSKNMFTVNGDFTLKKITLSSDQSIVHSRGIILLQNEGNLTLDTGATIQNTHVEEGTSEAVSGGAVRSAGTGTITMKTGSLITNCWARDGGAVFLQGGGKLDMENGSVISNCQSYYWGGAVQIRKGTVNMKNGAKIEGCEAGTTLIPQQQGKSPDGKGGAIYVNQEVGDAHLNIGNGAEIKSCKAGNHGGGIYADIAAATYNTPEDGSEPVLTKAANSFSFAGTIDSCQAPNDGGGIYIAQGTVSVTGGEIKNCRSTNGAGIYQDRGTLTAEGISIENNVASGSGGGIYGKNIISLTNSTIKNCKAVTAGGGIYRTNNNDGKVTLSGTSKIEGCYAGKGGGIYSDKPVDLLTAGMAIKNCKARDVTVGTDGTVTVASTANENNLGGGVYQNAATLNIYSAAGTVIDGCEAYNGGGVYAKGHLYLGKSGNDNAALYGSITSCKAVNGAGVYHVSNNFYIYTANSVISGNESSDKGGGVYHMGGDFRVQNGSIASNKANYGGGVYVANGTAETAVQMQVYGNGSIERNEALCADAGGGIEVGGEYVRILFSGSAQVKNNNNATTKSNTERFCNVYLNQDSNAIIRTHNALNSDAYIGVYAENTAINGEKTVFTEHGEMGDPFGYRTHASNLKCFVNDRNPLLYGTKGADSSTIYWSSFICKITDTEGNLLYKDAAHKIPAVYEELGFKGGLDGNKAAYVKTHAFNQINYGTNNDSRLYNENGTEYTGPNYFVQMLVENYVTDKDKNNWMLAAETGKTVTLMTASPDDTDGYPYRGTAGTYCTIKHGTGYNGSSLFTTFGNLILKDITLDGGAEFNANGEYTGGIKLTQAGGLVALMNGDDSFGGSGARLTIGENATLQNAYNAGSGNNLGGGAVSNSSQDKGKKSNVVTMNGGTIKNCVTDGNGGAINLAKGTFNMSGGTIEDCTAVGNGGAVYLAANAKMTMNGGTITRNTASVGAGVYLVQGSELKVSGTPGFGTNGNALVTETEETNGKRQDIYIAGYLGKVGGNGANKDDPKLAESLIVSGALNLAKGSIWVGAEVQENQDYNHWDTLKQFAKFADNLITGEGDNRRVNLNNTQLEKTLSAFRNATTSEEYYGSTGENIQCIYWDGVKGSRRVILRKTASGSYQPLQGAKFEIHRGNADGPSVTIKDREGNDVSTFESGPSGAFFVGNLDYGTYIVKEVKAPNETGYVGNLGKTFTITVNESGVGYLDADQKFHKEVTQ